MESEAQKNKRRSDELTEQVASKEQKHKAESKKGEVLGLFLVNGQVVRRTKTKRGVYSDHIGSQDYCDRNRIKYTVETK
jgi:hypothetical protein